MPENPIGSIIWTDLSIVNTDDILHFYTEVVGWTSSPVNCGEFDDYEMKEPSSGKVVAGICNAKGINADLPPQWLIYIAVEDIDKSVARCIELGGRLIHGPRMLGDKRFCVIQDPSGAVAGLLS
jgi:uncharacterized protein